MIALIMKVKQIRSLTSKKNQLETIRELRDNHTGTEAYRLYFYSGKAHLQQPTKLYSYSTL